MGLLSKRLFACVTSVGLVLLTTAGTWVMGPGKGVHGSAGFLTLNEDFSAFTGQNIPVGNGDTVTEHLLQWTATSTNASVGKVEMRLRKVGAPSGTYRIRILSDSTNTPGAQLAATATVSSSTLSTSYATIGLDFASTWSKTNATKYWISVELSVTGDGSNYVEIDCTLSTGNLHWYDVSGDSFGDWGATATPWFKLYVP